MTTELKERQPLSNRQRKILAKRIRAEQASAPRQLADTPKRNREREEYVQPAPADGENIIHEQGKTGRPIAVRLDPLMKLRRAGRITEDEYRAGEAYLAVVQAYYAAGSGLFRSDVEHAVSTSGGDPIRLYGKGRRKYVSTQKPRIIAAPRTSFDGWSGARTDAMDALTRIKRALRPVSAPALLTLYALVIHPNAPDKRSTTLRAYVEKQYGYRNQYSEERIVILLREALNALWKELETGAASRKAA